MTDLASSHLTDLLAYIAPGMLVVVAWALRYRPERFTVAQEKLGVAESVLGLLAAYLIGLILVRASGLIVLPLTWAFGENPLEATVVSFPSYKLLLHHLNGNDGVGAAGPVDAYRYAGALIAEKAPRSADAAERLMAISLLARNLILAVPLALGLAWTRLGIGSSRLRVSLSFVALTILELALAKTFLAFWAASIWKTLRAAVLWYTIG